MKTESFLYLQEAIPPHSQTTMGPDPWPSATTSSSSVYVERRSQESEEISSQPETEWHSYIRELNQEEETRADHTPQEDLWDEVLFDTPAFLQLPLDARSVKTTWHTTTIPPNRTYEFQGDYRRFFLFLMFGLLASTPLLYWIFLQLGLQSPLRLMLIVVSTGGAFASAIFAWGPYRQRSIVVDHFGVQYQDELRSFCLTWEDVEAIHLHAVEAFFNPYPLCYVRVVTRSGVEFAFANFGTHLFGIRRHVSFGSPSYPIIDVRDSDVLLALLVQQSHQSKQSPDLQRLRYRAQHEIESEEQEDELLAKKPAQPSTSHENPWIGLWAIFGKVMAKWLPQSAKLLLQTIKPGYLGVSVGLYAVFFQWQFALVLGLLLVGHELGHVWAMYREGMRIRGVYLLPFFGAATVTEDTWPSWASLARVSLAGPLWGTYLTAICFLLYLLFPNPFWLLAAVLGALLNLLNLLPVQPLDGGRILHAVAYSLRSASGLALTLGVLVGAIVLSISLEFLLLYILSLIGLAEFFRDYMFRQRAEKLALLHNKMDITGRDIFLLKSITGINFGLNSSPHALEREEILLKRLRMLLHAPVMTGKQIIQIGMATVAVAATLFGFLFLMALNHPSMTWVLELFK